MAESKGLGDTVEWMIEQTRLNRLAKKNCPTCAKTKDWLNKVVPYTKKIKE